MLAMTEMVFRDRNDYRIKINRKFHWPKKPDSEVCIYGSAGPEQVAPVYWYQVSRLSDSVNLTLVHNILPV